MPRYKAIVKLHLPMDRPWRDDVSDKSFEVKGSAPQELWLEMIREMTQRLSMARDPHFFVGLLCELINPFPDDVRANLITGIAMGLGLNINKLGSTLQGEIVPKFPSLPLPGPDGTPEKRTASGLVLP